MGRGGGDYRKRREKEKKKDNTGGKDREKGGKKRRGKKKEDARSVLRTPALLNEVVPRCLRSSLERLPPASLRC